MKFQQIHPPANLKDYIRYYWVLESDVLETLPKNFAAIADGSPGIIFHQAEGGQFYQEGKVLPPVFLYGQTTKYTELCSTGRFRNIGVYFYPHAIRSVFGFNAAELTNSCVDVNLIPSKDYKRLSERLFNTPGLNDQIDLLSAYLFAQVKQNNTSDDKLISYALTKMFEAKGDINLKLLQDDLRLSERSLERRFKYDIGISPKLLSRIFRFQSAMNLLRAGSYYNLSDIAYEHNYADQSHFIRSFKEFAGVSPNQFQKQSNELIENFPEIGP